MAPAPKLKMPKGEVVATEGSIIAGEENLIDLDDDKTLKPQALRRNATLDGPSMKLNGSHSELGTSPINPSNLRRTSSLAGASDHDGPLRRASTAEVREHLKHLGPSNLASRPRQTRYNTVKIKPGGGSVVENATKIHESADAPTVLSLSGAPQGGVGAGLLNSAGKDAKDGVQAVQAGYGSMGTSPKTPQQGDQSFQLDGNKSSSQQTQGADKNHQDSSDKSRPTSSSSDSTLAPLDDGYRTKKPRKYKSVARSGSITENIVEAGGIKKTVLETTNSSSDDVDNQAADGDDDNDNNAQLENENPADGVSDDGDENENGSKGGGGKKKRRRKKKKGAKGDEDTPLLER